MTATLTGPEVARTTVDEMLETARRRLDRLSPGDVVAALRHGAVVVDIRPRELRRAVGEIPGSIAVERNVLEWRFDPAGPHRLERVSSYDLRVVVVCQEGYTSSLAAAALQDLGLWRATDLAGGVAAWRLAGYPLAAGGGPPLP